MPGVHPTPLLNTSLPAQFRQIRVELARETHHPDGDTDIAYVIVAPLDVNGRIDPKLWRKYREACRVARLRPDTEDRLGHLVPRHNGGWAFHYDANANMPDEIGLHFTNECFVPGEYVSINEGGKIHTYRVASVHHL